VTMLTRRLAAVCGLLMVLLTLGCVPPPQAASTYTIPTSIADNCSSDATAQVTSWLGTVPDGAIAQFRSDKCYRIDGTIELTGRALTIAGGGATVRSTKALTSGNADDDQRAMWRFIGSTVTVHDLTVLGSYTHGGTLDETLQHAHAFDARGSNLTLKHVTVSDVAGDCVYFGLGYDSTTKSTGSVTDLTCRSIGRNGVSLTAAHDVTVQQSSFDRVGYTVVDVEPNVGPGWGTSGTLVTGNTIGSYRLYALGVIANAPNDSVTFTGNDASSAEGLRVGVVAPNGVRARPSAVTISANTADQATQSPAIEAHSVDGLTVTDNTISLSGGPLVTSDDSCRLIVLNNTFPGGSSEADITNPC